MLCMRKSAHHRCRVNKEKEMSQQWISITNKLPEDETVVMLFVPNEGQSICIGYREDDVWWYEDSLPLLEVVTHWMPLPEDPQVK